MHSSTDLSAYDEDIKESNVLLNHFGCDVRFTAYDRRQRLLQNKRIVYVLADYGLSMILPSGVDRLDANQSWMVFAHRPLDTMQGELDYDAFAYDVGALGVLFCHKFQVSDLCRVTFICSSNLNTCHQYLVPSFPMLAPLLDGMVTANVQERFTASKALKFLRTAVRPNISQDQKNKQISQSLMRGHIKDDRWKGLSTEFVVRWGSYRARKPSKFTLLLRHFCTYQWCWCFVRSVRWLARLPGHLLGSVVL